MYVFESFSISSPFGSQLSRMWMIGVGTLCAYAHYRASLFNVKKAVKYVQFTLRDSDKNPTNEGNKKVTAAIWKQMMFNHENY